MAYQITGVSVVYSTVYSGTDQRWHQSSASLALIPRTKGQWRGKCFHLMTSSWWRCVTPCWFGFVFYLWPQITQKRSKTTIEDVICVFSYWLRPFSCDLSRYIKGRRWFLSISTKTNEQMYHCIQNGHTLAIHCKCVFGELQHYHEVFHWRFSSIKLPNYPHESVEILKSQMDHGIVFWLFLLTELTRLCINIWAALYASLLTMYNIDIRIQ